MAVFNEPIQWEHPLGNNADISTLPDDATAIAGIASLQKLFQIINATPLEAGGIAPDREDVNALFKYLGDQIFYTLNGGIPSYNADYDYIAGRVVLYNDNLYKCIQANGASSTIAAPDSDTAYWQRLDNYVRSVNGVNADAEGNVVIASGYPSERYIELSMGSPVPTGDGRYFYDVTYTAPENGYFCIQADSVRNQDCELRMDNIDRGWQNPIAYVAENATSSRRMSIYLPVAKGQRCRTYAIYIDINSAHLVFCYGEN